jgi:hypothetical protein
MFPFAMSWSDLSTGRGSRIIAPATNSLQGLFRRYYHTVTRPCTAQSASFSGGTAI